jgi:hypothetical protein
VWDQHVNSVNQTKEKYIEIIVTTVNNGVYYLLISKWQIMRCLCVIYVWIQPCTRDPDHPRPLPQSADTNTPWRKNLMRPDTNPETGRDYLVSEWAGQPHGYLINPACRMMKLRGSIFLRNNDNLLQVHTTSQVRRPTSTPSPPWERHIFGQHQQLTCNYAGGTDFAPYINRSSALIVYKLRSSPSHSFLLVTP